MNPQDLNMFMSYKNRCLKMKLVCAANYWIYSLSLHPLIKKQFKKGTKQRRRKKHPSKLTVSVSFPKPWKATVSASLRFKYVKKLQEKDAHNFVCTTKWLIIYSLCLHPLKKKQLKKGTKQRRRRKQKL